MDKIKSYCFLTSCFLLVEVIVFSGYAFAFQSTGLNDGQSEKELVIEFYDHSMEPELIKQLKVNEINFRLSGNNKIYYGERYFIKVYKIFHSLLDDKYPSPRYSWNDIENLNRFMDMLSSKNIPFVLFETISAGFTIYLQKKYSAVVSNMVKQIREEEKREFIRRFQDKLDEKKGDSLNQ